MEGKGLYASLRILGYAILLLMVVAIVYSSFISVKYWSGIGV